MSSSAFFYNNIIHITTFVWWRLNVLYIMLKIIAFFVIPLFARLYVRVGILLTRGNHLHDRIISLRGEVLAHYPKLTSHFLVKYMYQARKGSGQIFLQFWYLMLELFGQCFVFFILLYIFFEPHTQSTSPVEDCNPKYISWQSYQSTLCLQREDKLSCVFMDRLDKKVALIRYQIAQP